MRLELYFPCDPERLFMLTKYDCFEMFGDTGYAKNRYFLKPYTQVFPLNVMCLTSYTLLQRW